MTANIRPFNASTDADRVARFINDHGFGPVVTGLPLDGESILAAIQECGMRLFLVAESRGAIVGTLGYARMSGRRVAPEGHLIAVMFVVERTLRGGFLVGELFAESFRRFPSLGLRTLRLEVDPANRRAFPLYVRVGFRNVSFPNPDEDGYLELVNHLPGLASALGLGHSGAASPSVPGSETRSLRRAREMSLSSGVHVDRSGRGSIDYTALFGTRKVQASVDAQTGRILTATIDGDPVESQAPVVASAPAARHAPLRRAMGAFEAEMDRATGTLLVRSRERLGPLVVDAFPVCGETPAGVRRPARTPVAVFSTTTEKGTAWTSESDNLTRVVTFGAAHIDIQVTDSSGELVTASPWSGFRDATLRVRARGRGECSGHVVRGLWPPEATDFGPAVGSRFTYSALGTCASWREQSSGVGVDITGMSEGTWRVEGPHLGRISGKKTVAYRIDLVDSAPPKEPATLRHRASKLFARQSKSWTPLRSARQSAVLQSTNGGVSSIEVSPETGVQSWRYRGRHVLNAAEPQVRAIGPLTNMPSTLWIANLHDRTDPDQGVEWALHDPSFIFRGAEADSRSWTVLPSDDYSFIDIAVRDTSSESSARDLAINLFVPSSAAYVDLDSDAIAIPRTKNRLQLGGAPWRTWTHSFRFPTPAGDVLVSPVLGTHGEVLLRSGPEGVLATLLTRTDDHGR